MKSTRDFWKKISQTTLPAFLLGPTADFWKKMPRISLAVFLLGVFFIFGIIGSAVDVMNMGVQSISRYLVSVFLFGAFAIAYATFGLLLRGRSWKIIIVLMPIQMVVISYVLPSVHPPSLMTSGDIGHLQRRMALDAGMTLGGMVLAYGSFIYVFISEGRRYFSVHAEMELASEIHRALVPKIDTRIGNFEFYGCSRPSGQVGGDLVDLVQNGERWVAYIADVTGHGVAPGVFMAMVKSAARMYLSSDESCDGFLERLNSVLHPIRKPEMFVTMAFLAWDGTRLAFSTAGHPPMLQYCYDDRRIKELSSPNPPVGLFFPQDFSSDFTAVRQGDLFLLCTDGLLEVSNKSGVEFGMEGMKTALRSTDQLPLYASADNIFQSTTAFGRAEDDESLFLIRHSAPV